MRLGVVSDTHGNMENTERAVELLRGLAVDEVLHCGDVCSAAVVAAFAEWPTHFVFGNMDGNPESLKLIMRDLGLTCHDRFGTLERADRRIAFLHSDDASRFRQTITSGEFDLVCYGHTHRAESHREGETLVLNPGALHRANPHTFATVELETLEITFHPLWEANA